MRQSIWFVWRLFAIMKTSDYDKNKFVLAVPLVAALVFSMMFSPAFAANPGVEETSSSKPDAGFYGIPPVSVSSDEASVAAAGTPYVAAYHHYSPHFGVKKVSYMQFQWHRSDKNTSRQLHHMCRIAAGSYICEPRRLGISSICNLEARWFCNSGRCSLRIMRKRSIGGMDLVLEGACWIIPNQIHYKYHNFCDKGK